VTDDLKEMPFLQHLDELRTRLIRSVLGVIVGATICYYWSAEIFKLLTSPLFTTFADAQLIGTGPAEAFMVKLKTAVAAGLIVSCPWIFFQAWRFIAPGLLPSERKFAVPFVVASSFFFLAGNLFCYELVLPTAFVFFAEEFQSIGLHPAIRISEYLSFVVKLMLVFGIVFEMPVLSYFLGRLGIISSAWLLSTLRYAIVIIFIIAAIFTPPDVVSQLLLAIPLLVLYGLSILIVRAVEPKVREAESSTDISVDLRAD
jgi:sec-independent protein translocase protein TatC